MEGIRIPVTIAAGSRLGPYEVLGPLGAGGMGEVWRARDSRLSREVAIKVLPAHLSSDASRLKRFEKEARSASALNHPNIVTVYQVGSENGVSFIAMELVTGETLRKVLLGGALPVKRLLPIAAQIADGLGKAHEAGIVHRDLKPENVMVTKDGLVKILDFGLAKPTHLESGKSESHLPTMTETSPDMVVGTAGYMSPEQASRGAVDFRSDQFSFGSMLYEMTTGKRAFLKKTAVETLGAILNEEPVPIASINPKIPAPLTWIVERCLAKEPRGRYSSTDDLARDLAVLREHMSGGWASTETPSRVPRRRMGLWLSIAAAVLLAAGISIGRFSSFSAFQGAPSPRFSRVTFRQGIVFTARFAPDGETVVYGIQYEGKPLEIYSAHSGVAEARSLGISGADILSISRSGEMALKLGGGDAGTMAEVPLAGGAPRDILENVHGADWAPNGKEMAVVRVGGAMSSLEYPIGKVLYTSVSLGGRPRISPDGRRVAVSDGSSVIVLDRTGGKTALKGGWTPTWSPSGDELINSVNRGGTTFISATNLRGKERPLLELAGEFFVQDVSPKGRLLLERVFLRDEMVARSPGQDKERNLSWLDTSTPVDLSPDGKTLLFRDTPGGDTGDLWVYVRKTDGSDAIRIGDGLPSALSPDGRWALSVAGLAAPRLDLLPVGAGQPRSVSLGKIRLRRWACSFPDGKSVLIAGSIPGEDVRLYVVDLDGGGSRPISPEGHNFGAPFPVSPDGKQILSKDAGGKLSLLDAGGGAAPHPIEAFPEGFSAIRWCADGRAVFARQDLGVYRVDIASGRKELWREFGAATWGRLVTIIPTPDGTSYVLGYSRYLSDLWIVDGVR